MTLHLVVGIVAYLALGAGLLALAFGGKHAALQILTLLNMVLWPIPLGIYYAGILFARLSWSSPLAAARGFATAYLSGRVSLTLFLTALDGFEASWPNAPDVIRELVKLKEAYAAGQLDVESLSAAVDSWLRRSADAA